MFREEGARFWRGVREPWDLLGRMRADRALWSRYWRTVSVQAALTLIAGTAVFWVGKQGAEAWRDAFGPDETEVASPAAGPLPPGAAQRAPAPPSGGASPESSSPAAPAPASEPAPTQPPSPLPPATPSTPRAPEPAGSVAPGAPSKPGSPKTPGSVVPAAPSRPGSPKAPGSVTPAAPSEPGSSKPPGAGGSAPTGAAAPSPPEAKRTAAPKDPSEEDEADEGEKDDDEEVGPPPGLEKQIEALKNAPPEERAARTAELVAAAVARAQTEARRAERAAKGRGKGTPEDEAAELAEEREGLRTEIEELTTAAEALARVPPSDVGEARKERRSLERKADALEKDARKLERRGAATLSESERAQLGRARAALHAARRHERGLSGRIGAVLALLAALYASLGIAQIGVLAFSRDFHDALARDLSLLVHVAPEDPPMRPRIRLDLPWVRRKANRRAQFFLGFLPGQALISVLGWVLPFHRVVVTGLTTLWAAYWWMVMTAGQSARAWTPPETTPRPWYLRGWFALTDRVFLFRWGIPRAWGRLWERLTRRFYGPAERVEEQPLEFAGLALSRALLLVPVVKLLLRPLFPVCAAHLLVEHAGQARLPVPVTAAEVASAAARAPDAEARAHSGAVAG
jgi:hypothetical protein